MFTELCDRISKSFTLGEKQVVTPTKRVVEARALAAGVSEHNVNKTYGRWGKVLGTGAGGTVRLVKRKDRSVFAVKQFRPLRDGEDERDYVKKITAEFCVGTTLQHINIITTVDMISHNGH